jgi:hypothetical protein
LAVLEANCRRLMLPNLRRDDADFCDRDHKKADTDLIALSQECCRLHCSHP